MRFKNQSSRAILSDHSQTHNIYKRKLNIFHLLKPLTSIAHQFITLIHQKKKNDRNNGDVVDDDDGDRSESATT